MGKLTIKQLQNLVVQTTEPKNAESVLKEEMRRVLGTSILLDGNITAAIEEATSRIEVLERTGRANRLKFESSIILPFVSHEDPAFRKFAAKALPLSMIKSLLNDGDITVRASAAKRFDVVTVVELAKKYSDDDLLQEVKRIKLLEAGMPDPEQEEDYEPETERLGDSVKQQDYIELSDAFYDDLARRLISDYGKTLDSGWEEMAVRRIASSTKATSHIDVDEKKLLKTVRDHIEERSNRKLEKQDALFAESKKPKKQKSVLSETISFLESKISKDRK